MTFPVSLASPAYQASPQLGVTMRRRCGIEGAVRHS
jgi:hypothetical protein